MTVEELMNLLKDYPSDAPVFINVWMEGEVEYITPHHSEYKRGDEVEYDSFHLTIKL